MSSPYPSPRSRPGLLVDIACAEGSAAEAGAERHGGLGPRPIPASPGRLNRSERTPLAFRCAAAAAILLAGACGREAPARVAGRVLEHYRKTAALRPRPEAGSVRLRLAPVEASGDGSGTAEIEWEGRRYRETVSSAGATTVRGIQGDKAFFIDEDGVTRVGSEPMLAELVTRSYFWRRAYLFEDHERAKLSLGPMDAATSSVSVRPRGGHDLALVFDREGDSLLRAEAPRLRLEFDGPSRFRDTSRRPVAAEIAWNGLPTRRLPDPVVGGWSGQFSEPSAEADLTAGSAGVSLPAEVAGLPARLAIDADADGPLRISPDTARRAGLAGRRDVFGRLLADGVSLKIGPLSMSPLFVEIADSGEEGIDAVAGGTLFRETVVEVDPKAGRIRFHDPASWVAPAGFARSVIDDDGNVPVAILFRSGRRLRLRTGTRTAAPLELAARTAAELGLDRDSPLSGLVWGTLRLPPVPTRVAGAGFDPEWGDDGALGWPLVKQFHVFVDLPHRWIYVRPT